MRSTSTRFSLQKVFLLAGLALGFCMGCEASSPFVDHALNRFGYGPDPWSQSRVSEVGIFGYVNEQMAYESIRDDDMEAMLEQYPSIRMDLASLFENYGGNEGLLGTPNDARKELRSAKILRAVYSRRQLAEILTDFWFNHFNVDSSGNSMGLKSIHYEANAIRPHILGRFEDLLLATARHPAMLEYLDNQVNFRDGFRARDRDLGLNENYAREIMELHTLGVNGGYEQDDVIAVARSFTGWTTTYAVSRVWAGDGFQFVLEGHDQGSKEIMDGQLSLVANGGEEDGLRVIHFLANHPNTAERICRKLVERFMDEDAEENRALLIAELKTIWLATGGDLEAITHKLLNEAILELDEQRSKVKRPLHFAASAIRAGRGDVSENSIRLNHALNLMGENLYSTAPPTGLPESSEYWASSGGLLLRFNGVAKVVRASLAFGLEFDVEEGTAEELVDGAIRQFTPSGIDQAIRLEIVDAVSEMVGAPDRRRVEAAATLVMSTPEFLSH